MNDKDKIELEGLMKHKERVASHSFYSLQRFDLLIISISGAGIYVTFEIMRFLIDKDYNLGCLKASGILFTISIISNFISQLTALQANSKEESWTNISIAKLKGEKIDENEKARLDAIGGLYDAWTTGLNIISAITVIAGVLLIIGYNLVIF